MCGTSTSAPASAIAVASSTVNTYGRGQQVLLAGEPDHVDLEPEAHAGLLEVLAERAVEEADGGEVLHAREADAA